MPSDKRGAAKRGEWEPFGRSLFDDPSVRGLSRVGVVDIGSNSVRMVVFDGAARSPAYFYNEKVMAGLGQGLAETGRLNPQGRIRALSAMRRFAALAKGMEVSPFTVVATAAMREAEDGPEFRRLLEHETGLKIHVVDGAEEARLSAQGVLLGWPEANGLVCDIGGNSMELAEVRDGRVGRRVTSALGPFRLQQIGGGRVGLVEHIKAVMADLADQIGRDHERIYLVGGSWRAIARLDMERRNYPLTVLHEYAMGPQAVAQTVAWIRKSDMNELRQKTGTSSARMELVPLASMVLLELLHAFRPKEFCVSSYGIREGMLYEQMPDRLRRRDPLIEAARYSERTMARVPGFGKKLYEFLQPLYLRASESKLRLVKAACLLHDTTWRAHPDYRAEACFDNVTRANMAAMSHPERIFLGLALLHRYKNSRSGSAMAPMFELLTADEIKQAEVLGKALRFGSMFSIQSPADAGEIQYFPKRKVLQLALTKRGEGLFGEVVEARFNSLAKSLGAETEVLRPSDEVLRGDRSPEAET